MNVRRYYVPNTIYFITGVTRNRKPLFVDETHLDIFRQTLRNVKAIHPFAMQAYAFLPDHFHLLIKPSAQTNITKILHSAQRNFTVNFKKEKRMDRPLRLWQHRFWDHMIRNERDYENHFDYIHYNPVKHGLVPKPENWSDSSYRFWLERGYYHMGWGHAEPQTVKNMNLE